MATTKSVKSTAKTARKTGKGPIAKKAGARKAVAKKATRKAAAKKATARKATARKATAAKATARKATVRKATVRKATVRKATARKATARKATKKVARKAKVKRTAAKTAVKKAAAKKATGKATARKATAKKTTAKKAVAGSTARKAATRKAGTAKKAKSPEAAPVEEVVARPKDRTPRGHPDSALSKAQIETLRQRLIEERERVMAGIRRHVTDATQQTDPLAEDGDMASRDSQQSYLLRLADKERKLILEIENALERMSIGEYGVCEGTEEPIGFARLQVRPWTRYSVAYKEVLERQGGDST